MRVCMSIFVAAVVSTAMAQAADDRLLVFEPPEGTSCGKHVVLVSGDEEYRSEETMPMLGKILSQRHGFKATVVFALGPDGAKYIDSNNQAGLYGLQHLDDADLMIIATRFRSPDEEQAAAVTRFLNAGKPVIGLRTATHAFRGKGTFGGDVTYDAFGRKILGEQWVSHHGAHKRQGCRAIVNETHAGHAILNGVSDIYCPSDVYGVIHLTDMDQVLLTGEVTATLDPKSPAVEGKVNDPRQPLAWLHTYTAPNGEMQGTSFCTTMGASVDCADEDLRRLIVNAAFALTGLDVPRMANVDYVDPFYPSFYGFIREPGYWENAGLTPAHFGLGKSPHMPDPKGSPEYPWRPVRSDDSE